MNAHPPVERSHDVVPVRKSRFRIKSLMTWVALVALGLGWMLHTNRTERSFQADKARFNAWAAEFEGDHPSLKPLGRSMSSAWSFFELTKRWNQDYRTPGGDSISLQAVLRGGPLHTDRRLTFESPGRSVTWPFEDLERGRKVDLKAEFPGATR